MLGVCVGMRNLYKFALLVLLAGAAMAQGESEKRMELLSSADRVVFLGDSITYGGNYVADVATWMEVALGAKTPEVINLGLSSETVSGLSEKGHAGGRFPRPDLQERLTRVLAGTKPLGFWRRVAMEMHGIHLRFD